MLQSLVKAITKTQSIYAQQVVKNDSGEEVSSYLFSFLLILGKSMSYFVENTKCYITSGDNL
jgi:hypothetical protein